MKNGIKLERGFVSAQIDGHYCVNIKDEAKRMT